MSKMGTGPKAGLLVVAVAALPYVAGCADGGPPPPPPETLSAAVVCADVVSAPPRRVADELCRAPGDPRPRDPRYDWASAQLPGTDDDVDIDGGGFFFVGHGAPLGPGYSRGYPSNVPASKVARGVAPRGGTLTRFGGGTAGAKSLGSKLTAPGNTQVRPGSTSVSRGGLGYSPSNSGTSSSGGARGGSSGGSSGG